MDTCYIQQYMKYYFISLCSVLFFSSTSIAREWTSANGKKVDANLVKKNEDSVTLEKNGKEFIIKISLLSQEDQNFLKTIAIEKTAEIYPTNYVFTGEKFNKGITRVKAKRKDGSDYMALINSKGQVITPPSMDVISKAAGGGALIKTGNSHGLVDTLGHLIYPDIELQEIKFKGGILAGKLKNDAVFTLEGKIVNAEPVYDPFDVPSPEGPFKAKLNGKFGFIDKKGQTVIDFEYDRVRSFSRGIARVTKGKEVYYINLKGEKVPVEIKSQEELADNSKYYSGSYKPEYDGLSMVTDGFVDKNWIYHKVNINPNTFRIGNSNQIDKTLQHNLQRYYTHPRKNFFQDGLLLRAKLQGGVYRFGFVDERNKWVIKPIYKFAKKFSDGLAFVVDKNDSYFINTKGAKVFDIDCYSVSRFHNGFACFSLKKHQSSGLTAGKIGVLDKKGKVVIAPEYSSIGSFTKNGVAIARKGEKLFLINLDPSIVPLELPRDRTSSTKGHAFHSDLILMKTSKGYGYVDQSGDFVIEPEYWDATRFFNGVACVRKQVGTIPYIDSLRGEQSKPDLKWGVINHLGEIIVPFVWDSRVSTLDGSPRINKNGDSIDPYFIQFKSKSSEVEVYRNAQGKVIGDGDYKIHPHYSSGYESELIRVGKHLKADRTNYRYGYMDKDGNVLIDAKYKDASDFENGYARVKYPPPPITGEIIPTRAETLFINTQGEEFTETSRNHPNSQKYFSDGMMIFRKDNKYGCYNNEGKIIIPPTYSSISQFKNGLAIVRNEKNLFGVINTAGKLIIPCKFNKLEEFSTSGLAYAVLNGKLGYIDQQGKKVIGFKSATASSVAK